MLYIVGWRSEDDRPTVPKNDTCFQYANYVRGPYNGYGFRFRKPSQYDVILADPICPHHILQYISFQNYFSWSSFLIVQGAPRTPQNTTFIVRGLNLYINRGLLEIIKEGFTVIDEYFIVWTLIGIDMFHQRTLTSLVCRSMYSRKRKRASIQWLHFPRCDANNDCVYFCS